MSQADLNALIVANLRDLEGAASHVANVLQKEIGSAINDVVKRLKADAGWDGEVDWGDDGIWVAPKTWLKDDVNVGDKYLCQFSFEADDEVKDELDFFWLSQLVGAGQARLGFRWSRNHVTKGRWRKAVGQQTNLIAKLRSLGFTYVEASGSFFLPVTVEAAELTKAVADESPDQALQPIRDAFQRLVEASALFDQLIETIVIE